MAKGYIIVVRHSHYSTYEYHVGFFPVQFYRAYLDPALRNSVTKRGLLRLSLISVELIVAVSEILTSFSVVSSKKCFVSGQRAPFVAVRISVS